MSVWENSLASYIEGRLLPLERAGEVYFFRNNSFSGRIQRYDGSTGFIKNSKRGTPDIVACFRRRIVENEREVFPGAGMAEINYYGIFVGLELKTMTGRQSPEQKLAQAAIESAGGQYHVVRTPEQFEEILKRLI